MYTYIIHRGFRNAKRHGIVYNKLVSIQINEYLIVKIPGEMYKELKQDPLVTIDNTLLLNAVSTKFCYLDNRQ